MELSKKKYSKLEVEELLKKQGEEYQQKLNSQRDKIALLVEENRRLAEKTEEFEEKDALISSTLKVAKEKADEMEKTIQDKYTLVVERLKKFSKDWTDYFNFLKEKYPNYETIQKVVKLKETLDSLVLSKDDCQTVEEIENRLSQITSKTDFRPKEKIDQLIAATGDSGFSLEEVLNPGKLELEDLCKELGLME